MSGYMIEIGGRNYEASTVDKSGRKSVHTYKSSGWWKDTWRRERPHACRRSSTEEQRTCNAQVMGPNPIAGSSPDRGIEIAYRPGKMRRNSSLAQGTEGSFGAYPAALRGLSQGIQDEMKGGASWQPREYQQLLDATM